MAFLAASLFAGVELRAADAINKVEYFIDADPGTGLATDVPTIPSPADGSVDAAFVVPVAGLTTGQHVLHVRVRNEEGEWSLTSVRPFFVTQVDPSDDARVMGAEYFIDEDPGFGSATNLNLPPETVGEVPAVVPVGSLSEGHHFVGVRSRDERGHWGMTSWRPFVVSTSIADPLPTLTELFYEIIPESGGERDTYPIGLSNGSAVETDVVSNPPGLIPREEYHFLLWARDDRGRLGLVVQQRFRWVSLEDLWRETYFTPEQENDPALTDLTADPDGDFAPNAYELALASDPLSPNSPVTIFQDPQVGIGLTFNRWSNGVEVPGIDYTVSGLRLHIETANTLADQESWGPDSGTLALAGDPVPNGNGTEQVIMLLTEDPLPDMLFLRLLVTTSGPLPPFALFLAD